MQVTSEMVRFYQEPAPELENDQVLVRYLGGGFCELPNYLSANLVNSVIIFMHACIHGNVNMNIVLQEKQYSGVDIPP